MQYENPAISREKIALPARTRQSILLDNLSGIADRNRANGNFDWPAISAKNRAGFPFFKVLSRDSRCSI